MAKKYLRKIVREDLSEISFSIRITLNNFFFLLYFMYVTINIDVLICTARAL